MFFWQSIQCHIFCIFVLFLLVILLFKRAPMHSAEVPSSVLEHKEGYDVPYGEKCELDFV